MESKEPFEEPFVPRIEAKLRERQTIPLSAEEKLIWDAVGKTLERPSAVQEHLKNPMIKQKKLVNAGVIRMGTR